MAPFDFEAFRRELRDAGVSFWIEEPDTLVVWPSDKLTPEQIAVLKSHKAEIVGAHRKRMVDLLPSHEVCEAWRRHYANTETRTP